MGGGGLRILPHKSWNVWNFENRERVRRDEEQARKDEEERQRRAQKADQESRLGLLRKRAKTDEDIPLTETVSATSVEEHSKKTTNTTSTKQQPQKHINFFEDLEKQFKEQEQATEKEKKKKKELEEWQKKVGALTYLGQTVLDSQGKQPWYSQDISMECSTVSKDNTNRSKQSNDPLLDMETHLHSFRKKRNDQSQRNISVSGSASSIIKTEYRSCRSLSSKNPGNEGSSKFTPPTEEIEEARKRHKKSKKFKKHKKRKESPEGKDNERHELAQMKARQLARQREERDRVEQLLALATKPQSPLSSSKNIPSGRYSSQYRHCY
eukprot:gene3394-6048_t